MKQTILAVVISLVSVCATAYTSNDKVAQLITKNPRIMAAVDAKVKQILPRLTMRFTDIETRSSPSEYLAIMTYTDTAKDTFFNPNFGRCSLAVRGKIVGSAALTVDSITENDCGE